MLVNVLRVSTLKLLIQFIFLIFITKSSKILKLLEWLKLYLHKI